MNGENHAYVFDLDGVIRHWDPGIVAVAESSSGLPAGSLLAVAFEPTLLASVITGKIPDQRWREEVVTRLATAYPEADCAAAIAAWSGPHGEVIPGALQVVAAARAHGVACLLTNATDRLADDLRKLGLQDSFDNVFNSSEMGFAKPDSQVFAYVDEHLGFSARVVFLDDSLANIEAAIRHGWEAVLVRPGDDLMHLMADRLISAQ